MAAWLMLVLGFLVLLAAGAVRIGVKISEDPSMFQIFIFGFFALYVVAVVVVWRISPRLGAANVGAFQELFAPKPTQEPSDLTAPTPTIIRG